MRHWRSPATTPHEVVRWRLAYFVSPRRMSACHGRIGNVVRVGVEESYLIRLQI